ncbi:MAG: tyrosine-type recombinase/integrase [Lachnospiraceae bacterium]|nr:site-specific integrase [Lachnospiraceae bacterium]MEE1255680.1 tyrosine-type recombinase/integrase [Lachnospiraceae bacterium]
MGKDLKGKELGKGLSQHKNGLYTARFMLNGYKQQKYFEKLIEAKRWLKHVRAEAESHGNQYNNITVDEWFQRWIDDSKLGIVADNTYRHYKNRYRMNIKPILGKKRLLDVKSDMCQKVLNEMYENEYSYGSMNQTRITMHALFDGAVEAEYITKNPVTKSVKCKVKDVNERRVLSEEETQVFIKYAKRTMYFNAFMLVLHTGIRSGEVSALQWKHVNFDKKELYVRHTMLYDKNKGGFYMGKPKSKQSYRTVPLNDSAIQYLKNQKIEQMKYKERSKAWCEDENFQDLVFTTINGFPLGHSSYQISINRIVTNINNDRRTESKVTGENYIEFAPMYMHALRHTFATRCIERGMKPKVLQALMGHSSISITMDIYVHSSDEMKHEEIKKIGSFE